MVLWWNIWQLQKGSQTAAIQAARKLESSADPRALAALISALEREKDKREKDVCKAVCEVLANRVRKRGVSAESRALAALISVLWRRRDDPPRRWISSEEEVHEAACDGLVQCGAQVVGPLLNVIQKLLEQEAAAWRRTDRGQAERCSRVLQGAGDVIAKIGSASIGLLVQALNGSDKSFAREAACILGMIRDPGAVEHLIAILNSRSYGWREAAEALGAIRNPRAVEPLIAALAIDEGRVPVAKALGNIGDPRAVEPLISALAIDFPALRAEAAQALGQIGDRRAIEPLLKTLGDKDAAVRNAASLSLRKLGWQTTGYDTVRGFGPQIRALLASLTILTSPPYTSQIWSDEAVYRRWCDQEPLTEDQIFNRLCSLERQAPDRPINNVGIDENRTHVWISAFKASYGISLHVEVFRVGDKSYKGFLKYEGNDRTHCHDLADVNWTMSSEYDW